MARAAAASAVHSVLQVFPTRGVTPLCSRPTGTPRSASMSSAAIRPGRSRTGVAGGQVDDGGFDSHLTGAAIQDQVDAIAELVAHVLSRGRADAPEAVGGRRGDSTAEGPQQRLRYRVRGHSQANRVLTAGHLVDDVLRTLENERQRTRPEMLGERARSWRHLARPLRQRRRRGQMHDQRMIGRPALGCEDATHRIADSRRPHRARRPSRSERQRGRRLSGFRLRAGFPDQTRANLVYHRGHRGIQRKTSNIPSSGRIAHGQCCRHRKD